MAKGYIKFLILISIAGALLSLNLLTHHYRILEEGFVEKSICSINELIDCDALNASSYSSIYSIPISGLGLIFYLIVFFYSLIANFSMPNKKGGLVFCFYLSWLAFAYTIYLAYVCFELEIICLFCVGMYLVNILYLLIIPLAVRIKYGDLPALTSKYLKAIFKKTKTLDFDPKIKTHIITTIIVFSLGCFFFYQAAQSLEKKRPGFDWQRFLRIHYAHEATPIDVGNRPMWGSKDPAITIALFSDFQCPFCEKAAKNIKPSLAEFKKDVGIYFIHYPLDSSCNPYMTRQMHSRACDASKATICADKKGKFWQYHDIIFEKRKKLSSKDLKKYAQQLGIDPDWFTECISSEEVAKKLKEDIDLAKEHDVSGTPSVFVNGRRFGLWNNTKFLRSIIKQELKWR